MVLYVHPDFSDPTRTVGRIENANDKGNRKQKMADWRIRNRKMVSSKQSDTNFARNGLNGQNRKKGRKQRHQKC